jgi:hypothetical protein
MKVKFNLLLATSGPVWVFPPAGCKADICGIRMALPIKNTGVFFGKTPDRFWIMRSCDELAAKLEGFAKGGDKVPNLGQREIIVWLVPKT